MKLMITGGGTGGHIYPAIAIAEKFREHDKTAKILYIGSSDGPEKEIVTKAGFDFMTVSSKRLDRSDNKIKKMLNVASTGMVTMAGIVGAMRIIKKFKPDFVIGTGGFASMPVIMAASILKKKTFIHEQNAFPGLANRMLSKRVDGVLLGFKEAVKYFKDAKECITVGNPVRKSFYEIDRDRERERIGVKKDAFMILTFGGSMGSEAINRIGEALAQEISGNDEYYLVIGSGKRYYEQMSDDLQGEISKKESNIKIYPYIENMERMLGTADFVVSRAGAMSIAELMLAKKPAMLIPYPKATGNHQYHNAKSVAENGAAILAEEQTMDLNNVVREIIELSRNGDKLEEMKEAAIKYAKPDSSEEIYQAIMSRI